MKIRLGKWGNSLAVRIPVAYSEELRLEEGMKLEVTRLGDGLLFRPPKHKYTLEQLLDQIKPANIHDETDWGWITGREAW